MSAVTRRSFIASFGFAVHGPGLLARQQARTTAQLRELLEKGVVETARNAGAEFSDEGRDAVKAWSRRGADTLADDASEANVRRASTNAASAGRELAQEAGSGGTITDSTVASVFRKLCPLYPFC